MTNHFRRGKIYLYILLLTYTTFRENVQLFKLDKLYALPKKSMNELQQWCTLTVLTTTFVAPLEAFFVVSCRGSLYFHFVFHCLGSLLLLVLSGAMCHVRATPPGRAKSFQFDMAVAAWWRIDDSIENRHIFNSWIIINGLLPSLDFLAGAGSRQEERKTYPQIMATVSTGVLEFD